MNTLSTAILLLALFSVCHCYLRLNHGPILQHTKFIVTADSGDEEGLSELSHEATVDEDDEENHYDKPYLACNGLCKCVHADPMELNCAKVVIFNEKGEKDVPLDTAYIAIEKPGNFTAQVADFSHNEIDVLKKGRVLPGMEASILAIDFSYNRIEDITKNTFDVFPKLAKLKLTHNRLSYEEVSDDWLTAELGKSLHQLYLDHNYIRELDDNIFDNLVNLDKLVLDRNQGLKITAKTFGSKLEKLRILSLDFCGLEKLDENIFRNLPNLQQLSLSGNPFTTIPVALKNVPKLSILALSHTNMPEIKSYAFKANKDLKKVYLRNNEFLYSVNKCAFCGNLALEEIDFTNSIHLYNINNNAFGHASNEDAPLENLHVLRLTNCNLTTLEKSLYPWEALIKKLSLAGNPLDCSCDKGLKWLMDDSKVISRLLDEPVCAHPSNLNGTVLKDADRFCTGGNAPSGSDKMTIVLILVGLCGSVFVVGFLFARHRRTQNQQLFRSPIGFSNMTTDVYDENDDEDDTRLDRDFHPRPAHV